MPVAPRMLRSPTLRVRLATAFVLVALLSVLLVASLSLIFADRDLSALATERRQELIQALVADTTTAHETGAVGWTAAELEPVETLAAAAGAQVAVLDPGGRVVASTLGTAVPAEAERVPIELRGQRVGTLAIRFLDGDVEAYAARLRRSLALAVAVAAALAGLLAVCVGMIASRRLTRPLVRLIGTARAVAAGDRTARVGPVEAAPEIRELTATVDAMTDTLVGQERFNRDLVADVAHELRTPIAVLQAGCEAMLDQVRNPGPAEIGSLHEEVLRLARLVDDLQTLAAADAAALHLVMSRTDLAQVATEAADTLTPHIHEAGLTLNRDLEPAIVSADANRLRQVVLNLLTNAIKFTPTGGRITLTVRAHSATAELTVADTGIGIPSEELPRIFDRFWRSRHAGGTAGTGIGLAIVAGLVHAHNGTVDVDSTPGAGTAITVRLPLAAPVRAAVASI